LEALAGEPRDQQTKNEGIIFAPFPIQNICSFLLFSQTLAFIYLHNLSMKEERHMTPDSFVGNNRGIGENG
jgi:hypothetical protein